MRPFVHDQYAPLAYKADVGEGIAAPPVPSWVPAADARRLAAYQVLAGYLANAGRYFLPDRLWTRGTLRPDGTTEPSPAEKHREYGTAGLLVAQVRSLLLGDSQTLAVPDADPPEEGADSAAIAAAVRAQTFLDWLAEWADAERLAGKLTRLEGNAVGLGDGVAVLGWDAAAGRPRLRTYDPGFFFPVPDGRDEEFPDRVHVAWEEDPTTGDGRLHRLTWSRERLAVPRRYPWQEPGKAASEFATYYSAASWDLGNLRGGLFDLSDAAGRFDVGDEGRELDHVDLGIDFVPVVHVPNDPDAETFGSSVLLLVAQLLDDIALADTDLAANAEAVASPPTVTTGVGPRPLSAGPGARWDLAEGSTASILDTSKALTAQLDYDSHLLDRLAEVSRVSAALLGRIKPNEVPSGYALELGFAATRNLVRELRLVRDAKYPLILRFAARMAQAARVLPPGPTPRAELRLGSYLPADKTATVARVAQALAAGAISVETAVAELAQAGFPIEDAAEEVRRIEARNFAGAVALVEATGNEAAAAEMLGLPAPPAPPPVVLPPAGG